MQWFRIFPVTVVFIPNLSSGERMQLLPATSKFFCTALCGLTLFFFAIPMRAQDLDPRAYAHIPVDITIAIAGFSYSHGGILTDATSPIQDLQATVRTPTLGIGRSFSLLGKMAQAMIVLPYSWADATGLVTGQPQSISRSGFSDARLRVSLLLIGAPAMTVQELARAPRETIIGTSISIAPPSGQYFPEKLINLGTNRWAFKPEIAVSHPVGTRWLMDLYAGVWFFTTNKSFYPGTVVKTQDPLVAFQGHISYNVQPLMWAAFDVTYYSGGLSYANGSGMANRQSNLRFGGTLVLPLGYQNSVKIAASTGAIVRNGADFTTLSLGWQSTFF
jgi:hypothetical protein